MENKKKTILFLMFLTASLLSESQVILKAIDNVIVQRKNNGDSYVKLVIDRTNDAIYGDSILLFYAKKPIHYNDISEGTFSITTDEMSSKNIKSINYGSRIDKLTKRELRKLYLNFGISEFERIIALPGTLTVFELKIPVEKLSEVIEASVPEQTFLLNATISYSFQSTPMLNALEQYDKAKKNHCAVYKHGFLSTKVIFTGN